MAGSGKYYVWGEGVWRELDLSSGCVSGWRRRARFVFMRRGRLLVARHRPVLRALEALAAGQPSAAADGPRLSHRSKSESRTKREHESPAAPAAPPAPPALPAPPAPTAPPAVTPACEHHHCCAHRCKNYYTRPVSMQNMATQCSAGPSALAFQREHGTAVAAAPDYSSAEEFVSASARRPSLAARRKTEVNEVFGKTPATKLPAAAVKKRTPVATHPADTSGDEIRERASKRPRTVVSDSSSTNEPLRRTQSPGVCKELIISEADVALLRGFVSRTRPSALARFDADVAYQRLLFHAINPLVHVERCARLERLLRLKRPGLAPARRLGRPAPRRQRSASADTDKENKDECSSPNKVRELASGTKESPEKRPAGELAPPSRLGVSERNNTLEKEVAVTKAPKTNGVASDPPRAKPERSKEAAGRDAARAPPGAHVISKRASIAKEYSNLEDHAIVAWVSSGSRASLVSGNRLWRDLQEEYERLTGRARSWHSLRNRYLRYILPALGALQLPPAEVSRLRAAAATGAIKTKNRLSVRRHSAYQSPERGAASRRARVRVSSDDADAAAEGDRVLGASSPKRRSLRSRPPESASKDTSNKDESGNESANKASGKKKVNSQASGSKESGSKAGGSKELDSKAAGGSKEVRRAARSPRYSEVTRRFATRRRAARSPSPPPSPRSPSPLLEPSSRSRRLFNPNANV